MSLRYTPVYIMLARRFDTRWLMMAGLGCFGLSMWSFSFVTSQWGAGELLVPQLLRGSPQVFAVAPSVTLGLGSLPPERLKYASGLFNMMRNLGGAVGIAVSAAIVNDRTNEHFLCIASRLTPADGAAARLTAEVASRYAALRPKMNFDSPDFPGWAGYEVPLNNTMPLLTRKQQRDLDRAIEENCGPMGVACLHSASINALISAGHAKSWRKPSAPFRSKPDHIRPRSTVWSPRENQYVVVWSMSSNDPRSRVRSASL